MKNFVGVGVTDAIDETRIGERTLQRVVFERQSLRECREVDVLRVDAAHIELCQRRFAANEV